MESGHFDLAVLIYVMIGMAAVGGALLSVKALRNSQRPSTARHRAPAHQPMSGWQVGYPRGFWLPASRPIPAPREPEPAATDDSVTLVPVVPYSVWPGDPVRPAWVDAPGRTASPTISLRDWYEDPYAGNVTEPHDPWKALYDSVARLRQHEQPSA
jgi:hypothetical protein